MKTSEKINSVLDNGFGVGRQGEEPSRMLYDAGDESAVLTAPNPLNRTLYIAFFKPFGVLSQFSEGNTNCKFEETLSFFNLPKNIYPCGRLDKDSEGLLLLTNDGPLINQLLEPKFEKLKTYWVQVEKIPTIESLEKFSNGLSISDYKTKPCSVKILDPQPEIANRNPPIRVRLNIPTVWLEVKISEGKNRQVRRMTAAIGHPTLRLIRKQIGELKLLNLLPGEFRFVSKSEII